MKAEEVYRLVLPGLPIGLGFSEVGGGCMIPTTCCSETPPETNASTKVWDRSASSTPNELHESLKHIRRNAALMRIVILDADRATGNGSCTTTVFALVCSSRPIVSPPPPFVQARKKGKCRVWQ